MNEAVVSGFWAGKILDFKTSAIAFTRIVIDIEERNPVFVR